jgi:hypothetical protein
VPNLFLGIPHKFVHAFKVSVLVTIDYIWVAKNYYYFFLTQAKNNFVYKGIAPNPQAHLSLSEPTLVSMAFHHWHHEVLEPPPSGSLKVNFDVAIKPHFAIAIVILRDHLRDHNGDISAACSKRLPHMEANQGEANATLLAIQLAFWYSSSPLIIKGDSFDYNPSHQLPPPQHRMSLYSCLHQHQLSTPLLLRIDNFEGLKMCQF